MAVFEFTSPTGEVFEVTGPDDATEAQAWQIFQGQGAKPSKPEAVASAADETGPLDAARIGAGKAFTDIGRGVQDLYYRATGNDSARADLQELQQTEQALYDQLREARPIMTGIGEAAPYMIGGGAAGALAKGAGLAGNLAAQGAVGAGIGGSEYAPTWSERGANAATEGALSAGGELVGRALLRMVNPGVQKATGGAKETVDLAREQGYRILPSSETASDRLRQTVEGGLESTPGGAIEFDRIANMNNEVFNRQVAKAIGEDSPEVTGRVLLDAENRIGGVFDDTLSKDVTIALDDEFADQLAMVDADQISPLMLSKEDPLRHEFQKLEDAYLSGDLTGDVLHSMQSRLGKAARMEFRKQEPNVEKAFALDGMRMALLGAAERSLEPAQASALSEARKQYRTLMNVRGLVDSVTGNVSAKRLATRLENRDRKTFYDLAEADPIHQGAAFMGRVQGRNPTSGTAERSYIQNMINRAMLLGGGAAGIGGAAGATQDSTVEGGLGGMAVGTVGGVLAPAAMARAYLSPVMRNWLTRQTTDAQMRTMQPMAQGAIRGLLGQ